MLDVFFLISIIYLKLRQFSKMEYFIKIFLNLLKMRSVVDWKVALFGIRRSVEFIILLCFNSNE